MIQLIEKFENHQNGHPLLLLRQLMLLPPLFLERRYYYHDDMKSICDTNLQLLMQRDSFQNIRPMLLMLQFLHQMLHDQQLLERPTTGGSHHLQKEIDRWRAEDLSASECNLQEQSNC